MKNTCILILFCSTFFLQCKNYAVSENKFLRIEFSGKDETFAVTDKRTGKQWIQESLGEWQVKSREKIASGMKFRLVSHPTQTEYDAEIVLDPEKPEISVLFSGEGEMQEALRFPAPFVTHKGDRIILPVSEGISVPVDEPDSFWGKYNGQFYSGSSLCMSFYGLTNDSDGSGILTVVATSDDASALTRRDSAGLLHIQLQWEPQKKTFGYSRKLCMTFFNEGGYVALAKRYRQHAAETGLLVTFKEKVAKNPTLGKRLDILLGSPCIWYQDTDQITMAGELRRSGFDRFLWNKSGTQDTEQTAGVSVMDNVLVSRYDNYQDIMNPAHKEEIGYWNETWTREAWPDEIIWSAPDGTWAKGWKIHKKGETVPTISCGKICDLKAPHYARQRISNELKTRPYTARFIDTSTATPWNECWHPDHPMTRTDSRMWKMKLLALIGNEFDLVTGCENGHEAAVPYCDYFEGMMSFWSFRVPDAGRNMAQIWDEVPENVAKYQVGESYRLPLWELVFHDCCVSYWYWGDYNNKLPSIWEKRDLFNALYGTPPMYLFKRKFWEENKTRFTKSYQVAQPVSRITAYQEMTDHRILTKDRTVQQSIFANGVQVTVNFGGQPFKMDDGFQLDPMKSRIETN